MKEQELINKIDKIFTEISKHKLMSTSDEERLLISISIQQAKSEAIKEFEKMIDELQNSWRKEKDYIEKEWTKRKVNKIWIEQAIQECRFAIEVLEELKQKLKEMK